MTFVNRGLPDIRREVATISQALSQLRDNCCHFDIRFGRLMQTTDLTVHMCELKKLLQSLVQPHTARKFGPLPEEVPMKARTLLTLEDSVPHHDADAKALDHLGHSGSHPEIPGKHFRKLHQTQFLSHFWKSASW